MEKLLRVDSDIEKRSSVPPRPMPSPVQPPSPQ